MSQLQDSQGGHVRAPSKTPWVEMAKKEDGWHWILWAGNGRPMAMSARPYKRREDARNAIAAGGQIMASNDLVILIQRPQDGKLGK